MPPIVIMFGAWAVTVVIGCTIYHFKNNNPEKIQIMSVRSELRKIEKLNKAEKDSIF